MEKMAMIVSHLHKFIFLKTKKTAGSSLEAALANVCGDDDIITPASPSEEAVRQGRRAQNYNLPPHEQSLVKRLRAKFTDTPERYLGFYNHMPAARVRSLLGEAVWSSYYKFAFERNPWDRQVSLYFWRYRDAAKRPPFRTFILNPKYAKKARNWSIYTIDDQVVMDRIGRYERLEEELNEIAARLGLPALPDLPRLKSGTRSDQRPYQDFYDEETRAQVHAWYEREIDTFGYEF